MSDLTPVTINPPAGFIDNNPHIKRLANDLAVKYASNNNVTDEDLAIMGDQLWQSLSFSDKDLESFERAGRRICPVVVASMEPDIQQLPWETLRHPVKGFIGTHPAFTLSRHLPKRKAIDVTPEKGPLRVLLFTSITEDQGRLDVEEEQAQVQEALMPWIEQGKVILFMPDDGRFSTLRQQISEHQPHLVFLSGHGHFVDKDMDTQAKNDAVFLFEAEEGMDSEAIDGKALVEAFSGAATQCVVLSACQSGMSRSDRLTAGLMQQLALYDLPHVIGMRESILDIAGTQFARAFCDSLAQGRRLDTALQQGRIAITRPLSGIRKDNTATLKQNQSYGQWCLPSLISQDPAQPLIDWNFTPCKPKVNLREAKQLAHLPTVSRYIGRRTDKAIAAWVSVYQMAKPMQLAQVLDALESLAGQIGLDGLNGWEALAQQLTAHQDE